MQQCVRIERQNDFREFAKIDSALLHSSKPLFKQFKDPFVLTLQNIGRI